MSFLTTSSFNLFSASTKAESAKVNSNTSAFCDFFNTVTSEVILGSVRESINQINALNTTYTSDNFASPRTIMFTGSATFTAFNIYLPTNSGSTLASDNVVGRPIRIKNAGTNGAYVVITTPDSRLIDGTTSVTLPAKYDSIELLPWNLEWHVTEWHSNAYSHHSTFTFNNGGNTTSTITAFLYKKAKKITMSLPMTTVATPNTTASTVFTNNTVLPSWARPSTDVCFTTHVVDNGLYQTLPGSLIISAAGTMTVYKTFGSSTPSWSNGATAGTQNMQTFHWTLD